MIRQGYSKMSRLLSLFFRYGAWQQYRLGMVNVESSDLSTAGIFKRYDVQTEDRSAPEEIFQSDAVQNSKSEREIRSLKQSQLVRSGRVDSIDHDQTAAG